jgi:hypothetical protein
MGNAKKMKRHWILILSILILFSCQHKTDTNKQRFTLEIPDTSKTHYPDIFYESKKKVVDELKLNRLENGADSFELRLWANVEVTNAGQIFIIKKVKKQWTCLHYFYLKKEGNWNSDIIKMATNFTIDSSWVETEHPKTNWNSFFKAIKKENIYELPIQSDIKGWKPIVDDGFTYYVEYATRDKYKFYYYNCPDVYENEFKECKQMTNILDVFYKEFGLTLGLEKYGEHPYRCRCEK